MDRPKYNYYSIFLELMKNDVKSKNELKIIQVIFENAETLNTIDITALSKLSGCSIASISRFVKRFPQCTYKEFTHYFVHDFNKHKYAKSTHKELLKENKVETLIKKEYIGAKRNLETTFTDLDFNQLVEVIEMISSANSVTLIGANHSLEIFSKLQLKLISHNIPTYIFKQRNSLEMHLRTLNSDDLVIFISVEGRYQGRDGDVIFEYIKEIEAKTVLFTQTRRIETEDYDKVIYYGNDLDVNLGYYSLILLNDIIEELISYKDF